jgi:DNA-binding CsgD family transcriptional regulator
MNVEGAAEVEAGREAFARAAWTETFDLLSAASHQLSGDDLERLGVAAYMIGRESVVIDAFERAFKLHVGTNEFARAVRCGFWLVILLSLRGRMSPAMGWLGRANRILADIDSDTVERGYMMLPAVLDRVGDGDHEAALGIAREAADVGRRCADADLAALAVHEQGHALIRLGQVEQGLRLLDEAMLAVTSGDLSPIVTGLIYCSAIDGCHRVFALDRAQEWTTALSGWCNAQPDMIAFRGECLVHRAEMMQMHGAWSDALEESLRASSDQPDPGVAAQAFYRVAELHRLRGETIQAERAYRDASRLGRDPQPGMALLRFAEGNADAAAASIRRALSVTTDPFDRAALLPALVDIAIAKGELVEARNAADELEAISRSAASSALDAIAAHAIGCVELAAGNPSSAMAPLRRAQLAWRDLDAPYDEARCRATIGAACRALDDDDASEMEFDAARSVFTRLGAVAELEALNSDIGAVAATKNGFGLSMRELDVLRHVARGETNREVAKVLFISEHTVARHLQNIFNKLGVSSRTAASSFAVSHHLV